MRGEAAPLTVAEARAVLGLDGPAHGPELTAGFRRAVKAARPDLPGGDEWTFRRVIGESPTAFRERLHLAKSA